MAFKASRDIQIHLVTDGANTKGWIHTHGLEKFGVPDLEIREIPLFLGPYACLLLNEFAEYLVDNFERKPVIPGQTIQMGPCVFTVEECPILPEDEGDGHYTVRRFRLVDSAKMIGRCHAHQKSARTTH